MSQQEEQHSPSRGVAAEVQDFYERYPYPLPIDSLEEYRRLWQDRQSRRVDYHLFWPARSYREDLSILIAGCGTSQAAKHALRWPACQVTGIDFSATSVRSTDTISVQERLPPGAAGVLINRTHAYRDLIMPIDSTEKRLFDAIDQNGGGY